MSLSLEVVALPDPDGHGPALALPGDWIVAAVSDSRHVGLGEASHSGDDDACRARLGELFERHVRQMEPSLGAIRELERGAFAEADTFVAATAISALDQALWDLVARREGVPAWRLLAEAPRRSSLPVYVTLNRALRRRDDAGYRELVERVLEMGVRQVKVAPFEAVTAAGGQLAAARRGLEVLRMLRERWPALGIRVDLHERLTPESALALLPELEVLDLDWIEAPCPVGPVYAELRRRTSTPVAAGELFFGAGRFVELAARGWADVVMPDVKHVGGFGPLLAVCEALGPFGARISPHNPSGDVSTLATLHAAAVADGVSSIELPLHGPGHEPAWRSLLHDGELHLPDGPGWGLEADRATAAHLTGAAP